MRSRTMRSGAGSTSKPVSEDHRARTVSARLAAATRALSATSDSPRLDAEILLAHVLGTDRLRLILDHQALVEPEDGASFERLVSRRKGREPVAYLTGRRHFRALELEVDRRVLIPRPETEELVEVAVALLPEGARVLDVGTGSGAIALALAAERPDLVVEGVDVSPDALAIAGRNRMKLNLDVSLRIGDLLEGASPVDAVLANLPYVEEGAELPVGVAEFEPALALRGGDDGLALIRRLAAQLAAREWPAWALLEIGEAQGPAAAGLLRGAGFAEVEVRADLSGRDRIVLARRAGRSPRAPQHAARRQEVGA